MIILGQLFWTTTQGGMIPPPNPVRPRPPEQPVRFPEYDADDEEIFMLLAAALPTILARSNS